MDYDPLTETSNDGEMWLINAVTLILIVVTLSLIVIALSGVVWLCLR